MDEIKNPEPAPEREIEDGPVGTDELTEEVAEDGE